MTTKQQHNTSEWRKFLADSMQHGLNIKPFKQSLPPQASRYPLDGVHVIEAWAASQDTGFAIRPRYLKYLEAMLHSHIFTDDDALLYILERIEVIITSHERYLIKTGSAHGEWRPTIEAAILERLAFQMTNFRAATVSVGDRLPDMRILKPLMTLLSVFTALLANSVPLGGSVLDLATELGKFVASYMNDLALVGLLSSDDGRPSKVFRKAFTQHLPPFIALIASTNAELSEALSMLQRDSGLHEVEQASEQLGDGIVDDLNALTYQDSVLELPLVATKCALYVYINASLCGRPIADDTSLFSFLNTRYSENVPSLVADIISASFDVLGNAINHNEPQGSMIIYKSFISNKLPTLLESFAPMIFPPLTTESCITDALNRLDSSGDPFSTQAFDPLSVSGILSEARQEFLFACALHGLIPESSIESILGDVPMQSLPDSGKYIKDDLVAQCSTNHSRIKDLIGELENMDGNSAAIVEALVEIIQTLCSNKDTMTLKGVCNALSFKTGAMDIVLLFFEPIVILQPLCTLIEQWQNQEDQSECHPVYEEFGSILLFILAFRHHFTLQETDLGAGFSDTFLRSYFHEGRTARRPADLLDSERQRLGNWVKGLFEADGISDELMSNCPPKDFYLLIPTLFDQSVKAFQNGLLSSETVKSGFEYLLEPFLLPSLVSGLGWAARKLWETKPSAPQLDYILPLVTCLVKPASLSAEASSLHETVLTITASSLERALAHVQKLHPRRRDIDPIVNALRPHLHQLRNGMATHTELEAWSAQSHGGILAALRHSFHSLVNWSSRISISKQATANQTNTSSQAPLGSAPQYTHRLITTCVCTFGAPTTLATLLTESTKMVAANSCSPDIPLDLLTAMIAAPSIHPVRLTVSLRQALQLVQADAYSHSIEKNGRPADTVKAELIVRLARRVEAQSPARPVPETGVDGAEQAAVVNAAADMMMSLNNGNDETNGAISGTQSDANASSNDVLEGMLKDVDVSADLDSLMDTDAGDLFNMT